MAEPQISQGATRLLAMVQSLFLALNLVKALDRTVDPGHFLDTYGSEPCTACKASAFTAEAVGLAACAVGFCNILAVVTFGTSCVFCLAGVTIVYLTATETGEHTLCCPETCDGGGFFSPGTCCFGDEACLDHMGRCCSADQQACVGKQCCNPDQSCISIGPFKGTCCPDAGTICNNFCCPGDNDVCVGQNPSNEVCCAPEYACGTACCFIDSGAPPLSQVYCANEAQSLCCDQTEVEADGICCGQEDVNCGGVCCAGTCGVGNQCVSTPITSEICLERQGNGQTCPNGESAECSGFAECLNGCCFESPK